MNALIVMVICISEVFVSIVVLLIFLLFDMGFGGNFVGLFAGFLVVRSVGVMNIMLLFYDGFLVIIMSESVMVAGMIRFFMLSWMMKSTSSVF